jgi:two-component system, OmpR family, phosphate regulon sensor histidine kinase PhoR
LVIYADASLLKRVFQNLIANAIKYAPTGKVTIGAQSLNEEDAVECWVRDNGAGIALDRQEKVFEKLETDPNNPEGTGLGLAIVKMFVEAHGGKVTVESKIGDGTTFRFGLPGKGKMKRD